MENKCNMNVWWDPPWIRFGTYLKTRFLVINFEKYVKKAPFRWKRKLLWKWWRKIIIIIIIKICSVHISTLLGAQGANKHGVVLPLLYYFSKTICLLSKILRLATLRNRPVKSVNELVAKTSIRMAPFINGRSLYKLYILVLFLYLKVCLKACCLLFFVWFNVCLLPKW